ncbi:MULTISPECIES: DarT ssDNA thymidine ADP-ribosyltransferase family protein [Candidatus Accumulibacter]|nr:DarT ssDNA thymidine ADP-ribosyltransferase family protein [Accumulibacter sp.]MBO3714963.1 DUF4433 domain-containing protein [Accumulibacter sp.]
MTTSIRSLSDLHLLKEALRVADERTYPVTQGVEPWATDALDPRSASLLVPIEEDRADLAELEGLLKKHDFWLGYSHLKGWALLDRKKREYSDWNRPFILLGDGSIDRLSRAEFSCEPNGPWRLNYWKKIDGTTRRAAGSASDLLQEIRRYIQQTEQAGQLRAKLVADRNGDFATRIGEPSFDEEIYSTCGLEFHEKWAEARRAHYTQTLPCRAEWLRTWAKKINAGAAGLEPTWSRGIVTERHLSDNGVGHLWHFTDIRNLAPIRRAGGLYSWAGLGALGISDAYMLANDFSRSCDARLGRDRYVRLSFIPNSWFFQRVRWSCPQAVWLRFSLKAVTLGEVDYSLGNAASGFVALRDDLPSMGINWDMVTPFSPPHPCDKGPTRYPTLYPDQVGDPFLFRQISNAWNSEVLIKHYLPLDFCTGVFDCRSGEALNI